MVVPTVTRFDISGSDFDQWHHQWRADMLSEDEIQQELKSLGLSKAEIGRELLLYRVSALEMRSVIAAVGLFRLQSSEQLLDLTWTEALEGFVKLQTPELWLARELLDHFDGADWRLGSATSVIQKAIGTASKALEAWLEHGRSGLTGDVLKAYQRKVRGYWSSEAHMRRNTTEWGRREARRLQRELDKDPNTIELRRRLRIPDDGLPDVFQAACWLYERRPPHSFEDPYGPDEEPYGPPNLVISRSRQLYWPALLLGVSVLREASRHLRREHKLHWHWDFVLCFYLLRGQLEPLPRKIHGRERPKAQRDAYLLDLMKRHSYRRTRIIYNSGLSEEEFQAIVEAHPHASDDKLEWLCYDMGDEKGCLRGELIKYDNLRKIKSRWG